jgi:hypothetical protein
LAKQKEHRERCSHLCTRVHFSKGYGKCARPSRFNGYTISLSNLRDNLVLLGFEDPPTLLAALKDLLKITFLSAAVELIGHLDLSNINRKKSRRSSPDSPR